MARSFRADADELELRWVVLVFILFAAQVLIGLVRLNLQPVLSPFVASLWFSFDISFLLGLCCFMLFKVVRQPLLYDDMLVYEAEHRKPVEGLRDRENAEAPVIFAGIEAVVIGKCLYRQPRLAVDDIARETGLQMKDISWAINVGSGRNFNEYINRLRVDEVKQQLLSGRPASSLLELAFAAGFNSKSTFNAVFKRETGMTPTQYIKTQFPR
jgi:AraC-like DNA-binding protein